MPLIERPYDEKRDFHRMPIQCDLILKSQSSGKQFTAEGKDLSAGGVLFFTDVPLQEGDLLELHMEASQALFSELNATIEVVRVEPLADAGKFSIGSAIRTLHKQ